jgi:hypothetical protein
MWLSDAVGLGINCSSWVERGLISEETRRARDRVFYMAYIQDKYVPGRPTLAPAH